MSGQTKDKRSYGYMTEKLAKEIIDNLKEGVGEYEEYWLRGRIARELERVQPYIDLSQTVTIGELIKISAFLRSEDGENKEYDRALLELITDAARVRQTDKDLVAKLIDAEGREIYKNRSSE